MTSHPFQARLHAPGPKRILALDGGGTRGIVTIAFLEKIESLLAEATGRGKDFRLCEFFDLIGGTSVGSMLATMLAMGDRVADIKQRFLAWAPEIFAGRQTLIGVRRFDARQLVNRVRGVVGGGTTLGTDKLKTGLAIVTKRVDTGAVWVMCNNDRLKYFNDGPRQGNGPPEWIGNHSYNLAQLVRASTAAPYHFTPVDIDISDGRSGVFVDGGVSPHNNPALLMFLMATVDGYKLNWQTGADKLLIISVGTGHHRVRIDRNKRLSGSLLLRLLGLISRSTREDLEEAAFAADALRGVLADCDQLVVKILQGLSNPRLSWGINSEIGDLSGELIGRGHGVNDYLLSFQRYNLGLEQSVMTPPFGVAFADAELAALHEIDNPAVMPRLYDLARQTAELQVSVQDFTRFLPGPGAQPEQAAASEAKMTSAPAPQFRVAVTGHRPNRLPRSERPRLLTQLDAVMMELETANPSRRFVLVSGLAEGADRLAAEAALARRWGLIAMLPFSRSRYLEDFPDPGARAEFASLIARADEVHEAPDADAYRDAALPYAELGDRLIAAADTLIAIWDGEPAQGRGGTVDVMQAARAKPIPVIRLDALGDTPPQRHGLPAAPQPEDAA